MTTLLHDWIWGLTAAAILAACAQNLCDKGAVSAVVRFACALLLLFALLGPFRAWDKEEYALAVRDAKEREKELSGQLAETKERLERLFIEKECSAYILDEAEKLGLEGQAEVRVRWMDNAFLPWEAELSFGEAEARRELSARIESELGIPEERQIWR